MRQSQQDMHGPHSLSGQGSLISDMLTSFRRNNQDLILGWLLAPFWDNHPAPCQAKHVLAVTPFASPQDVTKGE